MVGDKLKILNKMRALCSRREYCTEDIRAKVLKNDCLSQGDVREIIESLIVDNYLSDRRYSAAFARDKSSLAGWGIIKIKYALKVKGISREDIEAALEEVDQLKADDKLDRLLQHKYKSLKEDDNCKIKLIKYAMGRGYTYDQVKQAVEKCMNN